MNRHCVVSILSLAALVNSAVHGQSAPSPHKDEWSFDRDEIGKPPAGWRVAETSGRGKTGKWTVAADASAPSKPNVLKLETRAEGSTYNLLIAEKSSFRDLDVRVRVKANSGEEDQGGGPIWRCRDENNYYICRINPLEGNFRVYKVADGRRSQLESARVETKTGQWYEVRAVMIGDRIECYVDGRKYLDTKDDTFKQAGMIGLWTKADASSSFDDVTAQPAGTSAEGQHAGDASEQKPQSKPAKLDGAKIDAAIGGTGTWNETEKVHKVTFPRADVPIAVDGRKMEPFMGFTSWAAFQSGEATEAMVMGDLVLFEDEVNPAMSALLDAGIEVTALHNHFFYDEPKVYFMHIGGEGTAEQLAAGVRKGLDAARQVRAARPQPAKTFGLKTVSTSNSITPKPIEDVLGVTGQAKDGMVKVVIGRSVEMWCGCVVGKEMGVNTWAAFAGTDDHALVDGDFAVLEDELQAVLKALRKAGINIVAIHHHMAGESPRMLFLHYWGVGKAADLARGVKAGLEAQRVPFGKTP